MAHILTEIEKKGLVGMICYVINIDFRASKHWIDESWSELQLCWARLAAITLIPIVSCL